MQEKRKTMNSNFYLSKIIEILEIAAADAANKMKIEASYQSDTVVSLELQLPEGEKWALGQRKKFITLMKKVDRKQNWKGTSGKLGDGFKEDRIK